MTGIILAAGKASRLGDLTKDTPKCLLDISGKCSLGRMLENLRYAGIRDIKIVTGFQGHLIVDYIMQSEFSDLNIIPIKNEAWEATNNAYSLQLALENINDDILVCNADVVCYQDLIKELVNNPYDNAMAVVRKKQLNEEDMKVIVGGDACNNPIFIADVSKQININDAYGEFTGIFKLGINQINNLKKYLNICLEENRNNWFESALRSYIRDNFFSLIYLCDVSHYPYIEIDFPEDLEIARDRFHYDYPVWEQGRRQESIEQGKRNIENCLELMVDFRNILNKYGIRHWLNWGLLLGCVREGQPLQYDTDLDICIDKCHEELLWTKVVPEMRKLRCFIPDRNLHCDNDCFIMREGEAIECNTVDKIGDKYIYSPKRCKLSCPAEHIDNLDKIIVMKEYFNIPSNIDKYLTGWYGNWKVPASTKPKSF